MDRIKKISYLFLSTSLVLTTIIPVNIKANDESLNKELNMSLEQGEFSLETSETIGFGSHMIENKKKIVTTGFGGDFRVIDARGTQEGWQLTVSATPFSIVEPSTGWVKYNPYSLPSGSLSLNSLTNIVGLNKESEQTYPVIEAIDKAIDMNEAIKVLNADSGKGMGEYALTFGTNALSLVIDPTTAKVDKVNYPNTITPYESTITWDLVSGPTEFSSFSNLNNNTMNNPVDINKFIRNIDNNIFSQENANTDNTIDINKESNTKDNNEKIIDLYSDNLITKDKEFTYESNLIVSSTQDKTITIPNLKNIESIKDMNGGNVKVLFIKGDEVTVRVENGYSYKELIIGNYFPSETKTVTGQTSPIYDEGQFKGTLTPYQHEIIPATVKPISKTFYNTSNQFPEVEHYTEDNSMTILTKNGYPTSYQVGGLASYQKYITDYINPFYSDVEGYSGYLNEYTRTELGEPTYFEINKISPTPEFEQKIQHIEGEYSGQLELKEFILDEVTNEYKATYIGYLQAPVVKKFYEGTVSTPDTRVYEYMQEYIGLLDVPAVTETRYQGTVVKEALDTRVYQDIYEFDLIVKYTKK